MRVFLKFLMPALVALATALPAYAQAPVKDNSAEIARLKPLADRGDVVAQYKVGLLYAESRNLIDAARYYQLAADKGNAEAQFRLAGLNCNGLGVPKNSAECIRLYRLAADAGITQAQVNLAARYLTGDGTTPNRNEAARLAKIAADKGDATGEMLLGLCYELGAGVPKDRAEAERLYRLAAAQGNASAQKALDRLSGKTPSPPPTQAGAQPTVSVTTLSVALRPAAGILTVPAVLNGAVAANFVVDSGASLVSIPENVIQALRAAGKLSDSDFTSEVTSKLADGSVVKSKVFVLRQLAVGNRVLENIPAIAAPSKGVPLLGQSFLQRFSSWSIDNERKVLLLREKEVRR
jgi:predicted aspartyl protease